MDKIKRKSLVKSHQIHLCNKCDRRLTLAEKAFNETLCNTCQRVENEKAYRILANVLCKGKFKIS